MPAKRKFLSYQHAIQYLREEQDKLGTTFSRNTYQAWHAAKGIKFLPRRPNRVYEEWVSWNEYLGTNNRFSSEKKVVRPYWDAVRWVQKYCKENNIETAIHWQRHMRHHSDDLPPDIPAIPHPYYEEFWDNGGYSTWIGKDLQHTMKSQNQNLSLLSLVTLKNQPGNIVEVIIVKDGINNLKELVESRGDIAKVIQIYHYEEQLGSQLNTIFNTNGFDKGGNTYLIPNISQLLFDISSILLIYRQQ